MGTSLEPLDFGSLRARQIKQIQDAIKVHNDHVMADHTVAVERWKIQKEFTEGTTRGLLWLRPVPVRLWAFAPDPYAGGSIIDGPLFDVPEEATPGLVAVLGAEAWPGAGFWWPGDGDNAPVNHRIAGANGKMYMKQERAISWGPFGATVKRQMYVPD